MERSHPENDNKDDGGGGATGLSAIEAPLQPDGRPLYAHAIMAALEGKVERLRELFSTLAADGVSELISLNCWPDETTLLKATVAVGQVEAARFLLEQGANPDDNGGDGDVKSNDEYPRKAPLHLAVEQGHMEIVRLLVIEYGANANTIDRNGGNPFHSACVTGHFEAAKFLVEEAKLDVNQPEGFGNTGLFWAVKQGHSDMAHWLVGIGAR